MPRPILYAHPFSSYCWKALIAIWENEIDFEYREIGKDDFAAEWQRISPAGRMPVLVDGDKVVAEASIIIEYLQLHYSRSASMLPSDPDQALDMRMLDRLSDNYLMAPMQKIVFDRIRGEPDRDPHSVQEARRMLDSSYRWWDRHMDGREWAAEAFGLADCATAPALFYADWVHPIPESHRALRSYRARLLARPSVARAVDEARPFRAGFPYGDPGRD